MRNETAELVADARTLCGKAQIFLISRGVDGALAVTHNSALGCRAKATGQRAVNTVVCGDYLRGLSGRGTAELTVRLEHAMAAATDRAWGLTATADQAAVMRNIHLETTLLIQEINYDPL